MNKRAERSEAFLANSLSPWAGCTTHLWRPGTGGERRAPGGGALMFGLFRGLRRTNLVGFWPDFYFHWLRAYSHAYMKPEK
jgi:hypothetical protein